MPLLQTLQATTRALLSCLLVCHSTTSLPHTQGGHSKTSRRLRAARRWKWRVRPSQTTLSCRSNSMPGEHRRRTLLRWRFFRKNFSPQRRRRCVYLSKVLFRPRRPCSVCGGATVLTAVCGAGLRSRRIVVGGRDFCESLGRTCKKLFRTWLRWMWRQRPRSPPPPFPTSCGWTYCHALTCAKATARAKSLTHMSRSRLGRNKEEHAQ